jgi:hypothetical protein
LFYALLNQHPEIALLYEGDLPHLRLYLSGRFRGGAWRDRWEFWNQGPSRHGIAIESMPDGVSDVWEATRTVYQSVARRKGASIWGEKTPHWYDSPLLLARKFPDARFIFLWRDMNAVMESIARASTTERFFRKPGFTEKALLGTENLRQACDALVAGGSPVHEVNYEDLTADPVACMKQVCEFLEIPFEPQMAVLEGADRSAIASGQHHQLVRGDQVIRRERTARVLSPAKSAKTHRYISRWKERSSGNWPKYPLQVSDGTRPPSSIELFRDRAAFNALLGWDAAVQLIYALAPLTLARTLRSWVRRRSFAKASVQLSR